MTREEMRKVEDVLYTRMHDQHEAARMALEIRRAVGVQMDASRPGHGGSAGGAYVERKKEDC